MDGQSDELIVRLTDSHINRQSDSREVQRKDNPKDGIVVIMTTTTMVMSMTMTMTMTKVMIIWKKTV